MPRISIIANFYKSEKYIDKLVKSVINQTFTDWELIAVNDCSPGRDSLLLHHYADKDPRIKVIDNPVNLGIARAKKVGIDASKGDYITFIDGDDWLEKDAFEVMYNIATTKHAEVVFIDGYRTFPFGYKKNFTANINSDDRNRTILWDEFRTKYYISLFGKLLFFSSYWGKFYKANVLRAFKYDYASKDEMYEEDTTFLSHLLPHYKSFYFSDYQGYNWRWGGASTGKSPDIFKIQSVFNTENKRHTRLSALIVTHNLGDEAQYFLDVEYKNTVKGLIYSIVRSNINDKNKALQLITAILDHPKTVIIRKMIRYDERYLTDEFISAFRQNDTEALFSLGIAQQKNNWRIRLIRKILHFIS